MGLFDSFGKAMKETAEKNRSVREATNSMSENELRDLYRRSKRRGAVSYTHLTLPTKLEV